MSIPQNWRWAESVPQVWRDSLSRLAEARGVPIPDLFSQLIVELPVELEILCSTCGTIRKVVGIFPKPRLRPVGDVWFAPIFLRLFKNRFVEMSDLEGNPAYVCSVCLAKASGPIAALVEKIMPILDRVIGTDPDKQAAAGASKGFGIMQWIMRLLGETTDALPAPKVAPKALPPGTKH